MALPDEWRRELAALREQFTGALHAQRTALGADLRALLHEARQAEVQPAVRPEEPRHSPLPWTLAVLAAIVAGVFATLYWQDGQQRAALRAELADSREAVALLTARLAPPPEPEAPVLDDAAAADAAESDAASEAAQAGTASAPASPGVLPAVVVATPAAAAAVHAATAPAAQSPAVE